MRVKKSDRRLGLAVGINEFEYYPSMGLNGCVNDAHAMAKLWTKYHDVENKHIVILENSFATKQNIMGTLEEMVRELKSGNAEAVYFSCSSHGTQIIDINGDEPDRMDEAICPYDLSQKKGDWDREHLIIDDELRKVFSEIPDGCLAQIYLDTCFAGTGTRGVDILPDSRAKTIPAPSVAAFIRREKIFGIPYSLRTLTHGDKHIVTWSACKSNQTSQDVLFADGWHGVFTRYFCQMTERCGNKLSRKLLLQNIQKSMAADGYNQVPQLECTA